MEGFWRQHLEHLSSVDCVKFKIIKSVSKSSAAITKKGHCLEFVVTTVKRENSLEPFLPVYFEISFTAKSEEAVLECRFRKHTRWLTLAGDS